jgi:hypothetical protein
MIGLPTKDFDCSQAEAFEPPHWRGGDNPRAAASPTIFNVASKGGREW